MKFQLETKEIIRLWLFTKARYYQTGNVSDNVKTV